MSCLKKTAQGESKQTGLYRDIIGIYVDIHIHMNIIIIVVIIIITITIIIIVIIIIIYIYIQGLGRNTLEKFKQKALTS